MLQAIAGRQAWYTFLQTYKEKAEADRDTRERMAKDHDAWLQSPRFKILCTQNFSEADPRDGFPYARMVSHCLLGGAMTRANKGMEAGKTGGDPSADNWLVYVGENPAQWNNLLVRALLGNQADYFRWFKQDKLKKGAQWSDLPDLVDAVAAASGKGVSTPKMELYSVATMLLDTLNGLIVALGQNGKLTPSLKTRLQLLTAGVMVKVEPKLHVYQARVPLQVAGQVWQVMANAEEVAREKADPKDESRVRSLVLPATTGVNLAGSASGGEGAMVSLVLLSFAKLDDDAQGASKGAKLAFDKGKDAKVRYSLKSQLAAGSDDESRAILKASSAELKSLAKDTGNTIRGAALASGVLSAGAGVLQAFGFWEGIQSLQDSHDDDERRAALFTIAANGIGLLSALAEMRVMWVRTVTRDALAGGGLLKFAGVAGGIGTLVCAVQDAFKTVDLYKKDDLNASVAEFFETLVTGLAGGAIIGGAVWGTVEIAGVMLSLTGIGLILLAVGFVISVVAWLLTDSPLQSWAVQTIWGKGGFTNAYRATESLNEYLLGAKVDYNCALDSPLTESLVDKVVDTIRHPLTVAPTIFHCELSLIMNAKAFERFAWCLLLQSHARSTGKRQVLAYGTAQAFGESSANQSYRLNRSQDDNGMQTVTLRYDANVADWREPRGAVRVGLRSDQDRGQLMEYGGLVIDEEHITG